jgi:hypothetical protein
MEALYPQNIIERMYPILREQREKAEREALEERRRGKDELPSVEYDIDQPLYENEPAHEGSVGLNLNTFA